MKSTIAVGAFAMVAAAAVFSRSNPAVSATASAAAPSLYRVSAAALDPCKLLTHDEAEAAMGTKLGPGELLTGVSRSCRFLTSSNEPFSVTVENAGLFEAYVHTNATPVSGIGDRALWTEVFNSTPPCHLERRQLGRGDFSGEEHEPHSGNGASRKAHRKPNVTFVCAEQDSQTPRAFQFSGPNILRSNEGEWLLLARDPPSRHGFAAVTLQQNAGRAPDVEVGHVARSSKSQRHRRFARAVCNATCAQIIRSAFLMSDNCAASGNA
jgi:hypothetical protein